MSAWPSWHVYVVAVCVCVCVGGWGWQEDYVKWKGPLFFRFVTAVADESSTVREFGTARSVDWGAGGVCADTLLHAALTVTGAVDLTRWWQQRPFAWSRCSCPSTPACSTTTFKSACTSSTAFRRRAVCRCAAPLPFPVRVVAHPRQHGSHMSRSVVLAPRLPIRPAHPRPRTC